MTNESSGSHELHEIQRAGQSISLYEAPTSLARALDLLGEYGRRARPVAGGTDLLVELDRGARPGVDVLVDLGRIPGLDEIVVDDQSIGLGPLVTHNQVVASEICRTEATPLAQACHEVGSPQLRNRATVAGNIVTASPANDTISALLALGASVELTSASGRRTLPLDQFFTGFRATALNPGELVTRIIVPRLGAHARGVFVKLGLRRAQAISVVHLAAVVEFDGDTVTDSRIAVGSVAPTVILVPEARAALVSRTLGAAEIEAAARAVVDASTPIDDLRAPARYRSDVVGTMARRALGALARGEELATWPDHPPLLWGSGFDGSYPNHGEASIDDGTPVTASVNGRTVTAAGAASSNLLDWLRDEAGLTGVKEGCAEGECGACTVHLDGAAVMACLVPAGRAQGAEVVTIEGLATEDVLHPIQEAFVDCAAVQCGFCTPGLVMASVKLLEEIPDPDRRQVTAALAGNLCRCTGYNAIHAAIQQAGESS
ncbi:MAG: 2Fe-2S iron-sulfur cluster binding domain-containing protein [Actinomycetia bacterium]|nr:2Fe-2S iron-sulfur cluster binding domain-containing protein [Actinomycetes bacterium]